MINEPSTIVSPTGIRTFLHDDKKITLVPLSPAEVHRDQIQLKQRREVDIAARAETNPEEVEVKGLSLLAQPSDIKQAIFDQQSMVLLIFRESLTSSSNDVSVIPREIELLLQEYTDVFPGDSPIGLPPIRGIEHQIDFVPGASIPNRPAYRTNPDETKELQRKVN